MERPSGRRGRAAAESVFRGKIFGPSLFFSDEEAALVASRYIEGHACTIILGWFGLSGRVCSAMQGRSALEVAIRTTLINAQYIVIQFFSLI